MRKRAWAARRGAGVCGIGDAAAAARWGRQRAGRAATTTDTGRVDGRGRGHGRGQDDGGVLDRAGRRDGLGGGRGRGLAVAFGRIFGLVVDVLGDGDADALAFGLEVWQRLCGVVEARGVVFAEDAGALLQFGEEVWLFALVAESWFRGEVSLWLGFR